MVSFTCGTGRPEVFADCLSPRTGSAEAATEGSLPEPQSVFRPLAGHFPLVSALPQEAV